LILFLKIVSEEKDPINWNEFNAIQEQFNVEHKYPKIPFIYNDKRFLTVPLSSVAVWVDPLDATKEFTG
jgi:3'-phosphoadenosine 5'-phosphosulfate (PAPS) 3'-phosphatase